VRYALFGNGLNGQMHGKSRSGKVSRQNLTELWWRFALFECFLVIIISFRVCWY